MQYLEQKKFKIGILEKGTKQKEERDFKILKISKPKELERKKYPILSSIIPYQVTLSPVKQRKELIHYIYDDKKYKNPEFAIKNISPNLQELVCQEWLRADFQKDDARIIYQLLKTGGNYADIDIFGENINGKKIACQVTSSEIKNILDKKIKKLEEFESDIKILFSSNKNYVHPNIESICLDKVWDDLSKNSTYKNFLEFLIYN